MVHGGAGRLRVGDTLALALALLGRHFAVIAGLVLPSAALCTLLTRLPAVQADRAGSGSFVPILGAQLLLSLLLYSLTQGLITHAAVQAMRGRRVRIG